jgi:DNA-binding GntR family transcriptional regulator
MNSELQKKIEFDRGELKPLRDRIASSIRDSIIDGRIQPGERLMEPDVSQMLGVSRTPVREAFVQLESEGFVKVIPRHGAVVSELSVKDAEETYLIKSALEALCTRVAVKHITDEAIAQLCSVNDKIRSRAGEREMNYRAVLELNAEFHRILIESSGYDKLNQMIGILRKQTLRYNYIYLSVLSHIQRSIDEHQKIVEALKKRDGDLAEQLVKNHGENAGKALCEYIQQRSSPEGAR